MNIGTAKKRKLIANFISTTKPQIFLMKMATIRTSTSRPITMDTGSIFTMETTATTNIQERPQSLAPSSGAWQNFATFTEE